MSYVSMSQKKREVASVGDCVRNSCGCWSLNAGTVTGITVSLQLVFNITDLTCMDSQW